MGTRLALSIAELRHIGQSRWQGSLYFDQDGKSAYLYDTEQRLWIRRNNDAISKKIGEFLLDVTKLVLPHAEGDAVRTIQNARRRAGNRSGSQAIAKLVACDDRMQSEIEFNQAAPYLIPIRDGKVVVLRSSTIMDREKEHYFTFECPVSAMGNPDDPDVRTFFSALMCHRQDYEQHFQKVLGCFLLGIRVPHFFVFWGTGKKRQEYAIQSVAPDFVSVLYRSLERCLDCVQGQTSSRHCYTTSDATA